MDLYLVFYAILAVINIAILMAMIINNFNWKSRILSIILIIIGLAAIVAFLSPIKQESDVINDCIAYYAYIKYIPEEYSFSFFDRCDFTEEQIKSMTNYTDMPIFTYPNSGNWNENLPELPKLNITLP